MYDPLLDTWEYKKDFSGLARAGAVAFTIDGQAFLGIGVYQNPNYVTLNDFWRYHSMTDSWTESSSFEGTARDLSAVFVINKKAYIGNGIDYETRPTDFWEYCP